MAFPGTLVKVVPPKTSIARLKQRYGPFYYDGKLYITAFNGTYGNDINTVSVFPWGWNLFESVDKGLTWTYVNPNTIEQQNSWNGAGNIYNYNCCVQAGNMLYLVWSTRANSIQNQERIRIASLDLSEPNPKHWNNFYDDLGVTPATYTYWTAGIPFGSQYIAMCVDNSGNPHTFFQHERIGDKYYIAHNHDYLDLTDIYHNCSIENVVHDPETDLIHVFYFKYEGLTLLDPDHPLTFAHAVINPNNTIVSDNVISTNARWGQYHLNHKPCIYTQSGEKFIIAAYVEFGDSYSLLKYVRTSLTNTENWVEVPVPTDYTENPLVGLGSNTQKGLWGGAFGYSSSQNKLYLVYPIYSVDENNPDITNATGTLLYTNEKIDKSGWEPSQVGIQCNPTYQIGSVNLEYHQGLGLIGVASDDSENNSFYVNPYLESGDYYYGHDGGEYFFIIPDNVVPLYIEVADAMLMHDNLNYQRSSGRRSNQYEGGVAECPDAFLFYTETKESGSADCPEDWESQN